MSMFMPSRLAALCGMPPLAALVVSESRVVGVVVVDFVVVDVVGKREVM